MAGRDLLADNFSSQSASNKRQPRDFLEEYPPESLGTSALYAVPRVLTDLAKGSYNFATQTLPDAYQKAKTEVPAFFNPVEIAKHPLHRAGQVLAGALEQGQNINRWPRNIVDYAANRLNLLPKSWEGKFPVGEDISSAIHNELGEPKYPGEALARGVGRNFLNLGNLTSVVNSLPHLTKKGAVKKLNILQNKMNAIKELEGNQMVNLYHGKSPELANHILKNGLESPKYEQNYGILTNKPSTAEAYGARTHGDTPDVLRISIPRKEINDYLHPENTDWVAQSLKPKGEEASQIFGIKQPIPSKYISKAGYHDTILEPHNVTQKMENAGKLNIDPKLIEDMRKYLPDDTAYRDLLDAAHTGDYNKLFNLQSDVGKHSAKRAKDWFSSAQREKGQAGFDAVNKLLDAMHKDMKGKGMLNESELLRQGRRDYRRYMKFKPYRNILAGTVGAGIASAALPKNSLSKLGEKIASQYYK